MDDNTKKILDDAIDLERGQVRLLLAPAIETVCHIQGFCHALRALGLMTVEESIKAVSEYAWSVEQIKKGKNGRVVSACP
ncbi:MAG: hypothetical protein FWG92_08005 [Leptospirales bacterium]|nr:hypothetical protein [Leptospirales bacterium]